MNYYVIENYEFCNDKFALVRHLLFYDHNFQSLRERDTDLILYYSAFTNYLPEYFHKLAFWIDAPSLYWKWHQKSQVLSRISTATVDIRDFGRKKLKNSWMCSKAVKKLKIRFENRKKIVQVNLWCKNNNVTIITLWKYYYMIIFRRSAMKYVCII